MAKLILLIFCLGYFISAYECFSIDGTKTLNHNNDGDPKDPKMRPRTNIDPSIVNGEEARPNSIPYQGALYIPLGGGTSFCGCSLINRRTVLTAAHCVVNAVSNVTVIFGAHDLSQAELTTRQTFLSAAIFAHANYTPSSLMDDIAIIHLPEPVTINQYVRPILLPRNTLHDYVGNHTLVSGWGRPSDSVNTISPVLREVSVPIISNTACRMAYIGLVDPTRICTGATFRRGTCNGDSGGPLSLNGVQIGVVSFVSTNGCESGWPPGYVRVTSYLDWIAEYTLPDETI